MEDTNYVQEWIGRLYAELGELKRYVVKHAPGNAQTGLASLRDLRDSVEEISARWSGPGAVEEIRAQREK